jgi:major membrane immunogen (membrane-anchored lipoprotein)
LKKYNILRVNDIRLDYTKLYCGGNKEMKKKSIELVICMVIAASLISCGGKLVSTAEVSSRLKDGIYTVETNPDSEGFFEKATVKINGGKITAVDWGIFDSARSNKPFDDKYEEVYAGNAAYIQQSRNDWKGSRGYGPKLIETQDINKVDIVSGATWTHKKFERVVKMALNDAKK